MHSKTFSFSYEGRGSYRYNKIKTIFWLFIYFSFIHSLFLSFSSSSSVMDTKKKVDAKNEAANHFLKIITISFTKSMNGLKRVIFLFNVILYKSEQQVQFYYAILRHIYAQLLVSLENYEQHKRCKLWLCIFSTSYARS